MMDCEGLRRFLTDLHSRGRGGLCQNVQTNLRGKTREQVSD